MEYADIVRYAKVVYEFRCLKIEQVRKRIELEAIEIADNVLKVFEISTISEEFIESISLFNFDGYIGFELKYKDKTVSINPEDNKCGYIWRNFCDRALPPYLERISNKKFDIEVLKKLKEIFGSTESYSVKDIVKDDRIDGIKIFIGNIKN